MSIVTLFVTNNSRNIKITDVPVNAESFWLVVIVDVVLVSPIIAYQIITVSHTHTLSCTHTVMHTHYHALARTHSRKHTHTHRLSNNNHATHTHTLSRTHNLTSPRFPFSQSLSFPSSPITRRRQQQKQTKKQCCGHDVFSIYRQLL